MTVYWVYILEIKRKNNKTSFYTGYTQNLSNRIALHKAGKGARYTKSNKEIRLVYTQSFSIKSEALKREIAIKRLRRKEKIELIRKYSSLPFSN